MLEAGRLTSECWKIFGTYKMPALSSLWLLRAEWRRGLGWTMAVGVRSKMEKIIIITIALFTIASPQSKANLFIIRFILH